MISSGTNSRPVLTNCLFQSNTAIFNGGGIYSNGSSSTLTSCTVVSNLASQNGGGIFSLNHTATLTNSLIQSNTASNGGGIYSSGGSSTLTSTTFVGNRANAEGGAINTINNHRIALTNSLIQSNTASSGGGLYTVGGSSTVVSCTIGNNQAITGGGGGIFNNNGHTATLTNSLIQRNAATVSGGGLYGIGGSSTLVSCTVIANQADADGGGIYAVSSHSATLRNSLIQSNTATLGGGVFVDGGSVMRAVNVSVEGNQAVSMGGGLFTATSTLTLTNASFRANQAAGGGAALSTYSTVLLTNGIVFDNGLSTSAISGTVQATYSLFETGTTGFTPDIANIVTGTSPYANATGTQLSATTEAIDAGLNTAPGLPGVSTDLAGNPRIVNCSVDLGAYEDQDATPRPIALIAQPAVSSVVCAGTPVSTSVYARGSALSYDWIRSGPGNTTVSTGQTSATLTLTNTTTANTGSYSVVITRSCAGGPTTSTISSAFDLTVNAATGIVSQPPAGSVVCPGNTVTAMVSATGAPASGSATLGYQWYRNGVAVSGQTSATLTLSNAQTTNSGSYSVVITGNCGSATSTAFSLTVNNIPSAMLAASGPITCAQPAVTLTASTGNGGAFSYAFAGPSGGISNANASAGTALATVSGVYSVTVTETTTSCTNSATVTVLTDTTAPVGATVSVSGSGTLTCSVRTLTLTASATSGGTLRYAFAGPSGIVSGNNTDNTRPVSSSGLYSVTITGANGCTASASTTVYSNTAPPTTTLSANAGGVFTCAQTSLTLTAGPTGANYTYAFNGSSGSLPGNSSDNTRTINLPDTYTVVVMETSTGCASSTTLAVGFQNTGTPAVSLMATSTVISCSNQTVQLTATPGAVTYTFRGPGLLQSSPANTATASQTGIVSVTATRGIGGACVSTASITLVGGPGIPPNALLFGNGTLSCTTPTLSLTALGGSRYAFSGPGIVSQFNGTEGIIVGAYIINRRAIPTLGTAVVSKPGTYTVLVTGENGCSSTATITVTGTECR